MSKIFNQEGKLTEFGKLKFEALETIILDLSDNMTSVEELHILINQAKKSIGDVISSKISEIKDIRDFNISKEEIEALLRKGEEKARQTHKKLTPPGLKL